MPMDNTEAEYRRRQADRIWKLWSECEDLAVKAELFEMAQGYGKRLGENESGSGAITAAPSLIVGF